MTLENCKHFLKAYENKMNDTSLKSHVRVQSKKNYDMMKAHIEKKEKHLKARVANGQYSQYQYLLEKPKPTPKKEVKKDVKK